MKVKCVVLISGNGTNLQAIINGVKNNELNNIDIKCIISNKKAAYGLTRANLNNIPTLYLPFIKSKLSRVDYDNSLISEIKKLDIDLIVCAGWMHILSDNFVNSFKNIINLHPALPGLFPGNDSITDAFNAYKKGHINHTGLMVHKVITEIDAGEVLYSKKVEIKKNDTLNDLKSRIQYHEKLALIQTIKNMTQTLNDINILNLNKIKSGKVRDLYYYSDDSIIISHTDRLSSFDKSICDIDGKGQLLCRTAAWWFSNTKHIINNHVLEAGENLLRVKKCRVIPIEFVVRGYITGSTSTSLWTHYNKGVRNYCGINFPDGLVKNQRLSTPVLTPTTKDEHDEPLSCQDILDRNILTNSELDFIKEKALLLFSFGQKTASKKGLILVDTKYEFGYDLDGNIILIDEVHTCDSSRYWRLVTYEERFNAQQEPQKLDKDSVRDYVKSKCDPYNEPIPEIPQENKEHVYKCYHELYNLLTDDTVTNRISFSQYMKNLSTQTPSNVVIILSGSESDKDHVDKLEKELDNFNIDHQAFVCSAHKKTRQLMGILDDMENCPRRKIYVTVAGRSNALSGVVACNSRYPVIACPPFKDKMDMFVNINSSLQMPSKVPVMTILEPNNVAISCDRIFNL